MAGYGCRLDHTSLPASLSRLAGWAAWDTVRMCLQSALMWQHPLARHYAPVAPWFWCQAVRWLRACRLASLLPILEKVVAQAQRPLLIIAEDVESEALATLILNKASSVARQPPMQFLEWGLIRGMCATRASSPALPPTCVAWLPPVCVYEGEVTAVDTKTTRTCWPCLLAVPASPQPCLPQAPPAPPLAPPQAPPLPAHLPMLRLAVAARWAQGVRGQGARLWGEPQGQPAGHCHPDGGSGGRSWGLGQGGQAGASVS
jgi:hypothetical protein